MAIRSVFRRPLGLIVLPVAALVGAAPAAAATTTAVASPMWLIPALPFVALIAALAILPAALPSFWHQRYGLVALVCGLMSLSAEWVLTGWSATGAALVHVFLADYLPFTILLTALFIVAGGIRITGNIHGSPGTNVLLLLVGAGLASLVGTTGAAMVMIRPLLRANDERRHKAHVVVFFIFLVANIGGALTPLGDPPLLLGYLSGVHFFWPTIHLLAPTALVVALVLAVFYVVDRSCYRRDASDRGLADPTPDAGPVRAEGRINYLFLLAIVVLVPIGGSWKSGIAWDVFGTHVGLEDLARDGAIALVGILSLLFSPRQARAANGFSFAPMREVAILFAAIFVTLAPVLGLLRLGSNGPFAPLIAFLGRPGEPGAAAITFWVSGLLSSVLDNAPTYLAFFHLAGGDATALMAEGRTLLAISCGTVFMGAITYIGNAPNFMVRAIAEEAGVPMPSFFGYMAWSVGVLVPVFAIVTFIFFR
ncbi:MAG: sodium:proton antiporter [Ancalomicrobiaceae bacterium]|nr:sodium:proton antiporter [Ancalomicrobiaceae bacterium]